MLTEPAQLFVHKKNQPPSHSSLRLHFRTLAGALALSSTQMSWGLQILPCLSLILLLWNQVPGLEGQEFRFGSCQVTGVVLPELWEAFWTVKNTVQTQDDITSIRLLKPQVLRNVSPAEVLLEHCFQELPQQNSQIQGLEVILHSGQQLHSHHVTTTAQ
uniref:Isoform 2 of Interleukin-24 n=1 Tax=Mus musculus TaxID=10090 RepID=Q925S4-2